MPQRLHRLDVRHRIAELVVPVQIESTSVVSREAGYIDVYCSRYGTPSANIRELIQDGLARQGIIVACIDQRRERHKWRLRFQNDLMLQQAQWGARGMSRNYRIRNGIDADAGPAETDAVRSEHADAQLPSIRAVVEADTYFVVPTSRPRRSRPPRRTHRQWQELISETRLQREDRMTPEPALPPLAEEVQDEPDTGILRGRRVVRVALEESER